jgi:methylthioribose-1-phosphate isomerase
MTEHSTSRTWEDVRGPLYWDDGRVVMLDQRLLPGREVWNVYHDHQQVAEAIRQMVIRGAPAIGCAAAMGLAAGARGLPDEPGAFREGFFAACEHLAAARPTAVNLTWALERQRKAFDRAILRGAAAVRGALEHEAQQILQQEVASCRAMGRLGAELIADGATVLTHCNTGALATGGHGTALGVIFSAAEAGKRIRVFADETRPLLQGARLTAWELMQAGVDTTLISDSMAGSLLRRGAVDCVLVGADRIARNGDAANKIGTYSLAVLAHHNQVPLYVVAPRSTIDLRLPDGDGIPIEERPAEEVTRIAGIDLAPEGCKVRNEAFDVTPHELVTAIVTEVGLAHPPDEQSLAALFEDQWQDPRAPPG